MARNYIATEKVFNGDLEAIIKYGVSCTGIQDHLIRVFLDTSVGCGLGCSYCWVKDKKIEPSDPYALDFGIIERMRGKHVNYKLKLMGQGDALLLPEYTINRLNNTYYSITNPKKPISLSLSTIFPA